jgi:N-methylhydantoinase A
MQQNNTGVLASIGVDVGSTYTDMVFYEPVSSRLLVRKQLNSPDGLGAVEALDASVDGQVRLQDAARFVHATTLAINALLTEAGPTMGMLVTSGFRDVLDLRRGTRGARMYELLWKAPPPLVPRRLRRPVRERVDPFGRVVTPIELEDVRAAAAVFQASGVRSVAVAFFNAYANPEHERQAAAVLREVGFTGDVSLSSELSGEVFEYERTTTTVVDAFVRPRVSRYLSDLDAALRARGFAGESLIMRSGGGVARFEEAQRRPFETIMSGPVAGAVAAGNLARAHGITRAIAADAGGTSFDTCLLVDGRAPRLYLNEGTLLGLPIQGDILDVRSIGAGGGSIARAEGGLLRVGPQSAGANPGPVCYGRGGTAPTVTDAAATLGWLADGRLAGGLQLDLALARRALGDLGRALGLEAEAAARGVIDVMVAAMAAAIRGITVEVGEDPRRMALIAYGGAGPLFACHLLEELGMEQALIPTYPGNFSACGLLQQQVTRATAQSCSIMLTPEAPAACQTILAGLFERLARASDAQVEERQAVADFRYLGQLYALAVDVPIRPDGSIASTADELRRDFEAAYSRQFGHTLEGMVEITALRARMVAPSPEITFPGESSPATGEAAQRMMQAYSQRAGRRMDFAVVQRGALRPSEAVRGPVIVREPTATTYIDVGYEASVLGDHTLQIRREEKGVLR